MYVWWNKSKKTNNTTSVSSLKSAQSKTWFLQKYFCVGNKLEFLFSIWSICLDFSSLRHCQHLSQFLKSNNHSFCSVLKEKNAKVCFFAFKIFILCQLKKCFFKKIKSYISSISQSAILSFLLQAEGFEPSMREY